MRRHFAITIRLRRKTIDKSVVIESPEVGKAYALLRVEEHELCPPPAGKAEGWIRECRPLERQNKIDEGQERGTSAIGSR